MPHLKAAFDRLEYRVPYILSVFGFYQPKSLLYVGWRHDCHPWWYTKLCPMLGIEKIGIVEIFQQNKQHADMMAREGKFGQNVKVHLQDVTKISRIDERFKYDVIFWDHGPEHVSIQDLKKTTAELSKLSKLLIYACPWGEWPQGTEDGNVNERHMISIEPRDLEELGMIVDTVGESGRFPGKEGELIAFKWNLQVGGM